MSQQHYCRNKHSTEHSTKAGPGSCYNGYHSHVEMAEPGLFCQDADVPKEILLLINLSRFPESVLRGVWSTFPTKKKPQTNQIWAEPPGFLPFVFPLVLFTSMSDLPLLSAPAEPPPFHGPSLIQMVQQTFSHHSHTYPCSSSSCHAPGTQRACFLTQRAFPSKTRCSLSFHGFDSTVNIQDESLQEET